MVYHSNGIRVKNSNERKDTTELYLTSSFYPLGHGFCLDSFGKQPFAYFAHYADCAGACSGLVACDGYLARSTYLAQPGTEGMCILYMASPQAAPTIYVEMIPWTASPNDGGGLIAQTSKAPVGICHKKSGFPHYMSR
mmetsp:Transcript_30961/g.48256  ORF Transcript_30961/g.48256 Transcript_30961/m.48256 type:complete len:138 (+) Transcript_30961:2-415(+)